MRRDQCFGYDVLRRIGEQVQNLCPQDIRITKIELARYRWRPSSQILLHLCCFRQITILDVFLKLRPSAT